ncbi:MAG TPA: LytR C-terminal domain-containing protein, partial [Candidatus Nitrosocosmicus sp.]|nr:LytR C-terminal domain-containing protein [Candidatus Nitrosocosmicus sp.]
SAAAEKEVTGLIKKVNRLMQLPDKEKPTVATVSDIQKLKNQAFFANAKNGDKVLIYTQAKKAILYRPSINKIIEVAPINLGDQTANAQTAPGKVAGVDTQVVKPTTIPVSVVIYNGSGTSGKAKSMETGLKAKFAGLNVKETGNAKKSDYTQNLVIDISGKHQKEAEQIAKEINAQISILPEGENRPDADLLVIVGR